MKRPKSKGSWDLPNGEVMAFSFTSSDSCLSALENHGDTSGQSRKGLSFDRVNSSFRGSQSS